LTSLGRQSEKFSGIEKNLSVSTAHARVAEDRTQELKKLKRNIFAVHVGNPFARGTKAAEEQRRLERHQEQKTERNQIREHAYESSQPVGRALRGETRHERKPYVQRRQYSFEGGEVDDAIERY
jgi:hypothetical protein